MLITGTQDKLLMIPGPTPVHRDILAAMSEPTISHTSEDLAGIIEECQDGIRACAGTSSGQAFILAGSGTLAQEAAVINLVAPGERLLVASNGYFGNRFAEIAHAHGIEVDHLTATWGSSITADQVRLALERQPARALAVTQVDTSTGVQAPVEEIAAVAREHGTLVIVDAVCSLGGMPCPMDAWGLDIVLSGNQKALGVPPGLAILVVSQLALERRHDMPKVASYYADLLRWLPSMQSPTAYFSTHAVNLFYGLRAAMRIIAAEGLEARFQRHERLGAAARAGLERLGFESLTEPQYLSRTLSVMRYPEGVEDGAFRAGLSSRGVVASACIGKFTGLGARFGHMGNITEAELLQAKCATERTLGDMGRPVEAGSGVAAAQAVLSAPQMRLATAGLD
ncbi:MAG: pyridoxal-phosphate-dependent aminotransferase family protein [Chloroflexota bacterium]